MSMALALSGWSDEASAASTTGDARGGWTRTDTQHLEPSEAPAATDDDAETKAASTAAPDPEAASETEAAAPVEALDEENVETSAKKRPAAPMRNRVGVGAIRTLGGANALRVSWYAIDRLSVGALVGFATFTHEAQDENGDYTAKETYGLVAAGGDVTYWPVQGKRDRAVYADLGVGVRATFFTGVRPPPEDDTGRRNKPFEIDVEIPVSMPIWFGTNVSVIPEFGFTARIVPGSREPDENNNVDNNVGQGTAERLGTTSGPGWGVELGDNGGLFFGLSFAYFFGG